MNDYTCPKPSCLGKKLSRISGTNKYICISCQDTYVLTADGRIVKEGSEKKKKPKYGNNRVKVDGIWFDSQGEANYYCQLKLRRNAGDIKWFVLQPRFVLQDGAKKIEYKPDFIVAENNGKVRVIDYKGVETKEFKLKRKMLESQYALKLEIVKG